MRTKLLIAIVAVLGFAAPAFAMTVQPVLIDLQESGSGMSQIIAVQNTNENPLPVEMRVEELSFDKDGAHGTGKDPGDLLVFPPQAMIQPGQTQSFRVQWVGGEIKQSKHYYVTVAQLPVKRVEGQAAIQILYNFQVLVSVSPPGIKPDIKVTGAEIGKGDDGKPVAVVSLRDDSDAHGYLSHGTLSIIEKDANGHEIFRRSLPGPEIQQTVGFGLIAAHQERQFKIPLDLKAGGTIDAQFTAQ